MGVAFTVVAVSMLIGTPINGALLGHGFAWSRAIIFCGVRMFRLVAPMVSANTL